MGEGEGMNATAKLEYAIGHRLLGHQGLCANLHGHNYTFEVTVAGNPDVIGLVRDFSEIKKDMRSLLDKMDHAMVLVRSDPAGDYFRSSGDKVVFLTLNPSAENLASLLFNHMQKAGYSVTLVRVQESSGGWATTDRVNNDMRLVEYRP
jgi:6-pyruvoyltetrahydropterin/6-carboxytetrahydropterin synthase